MLIPTLVMGFLAIVLVIVGWQRGEGQHIAGIKSAALLTLQILPLLLFAFIVAGMLQNLVPHSLVSRWVGSESGWRGILIGTVAGGFTPGGPYVSLPIVVVLIKGGAGIGTLVAFITGWSLLAFTRLPMELAILGWRLTLIRLASTFFLPPVAGLIAHVLFRRVAL